MNEENTGAAQNAPINESTYIEAIQEIQQNTVPREDYERLREENRNLIRSMARGERLPDNTPDQDPEERQRLTDEIIRHDNSDNNLEYVKKALRLREVIISSGDDDPFVPVGPNIQPTSSDREAAERVADVLSECVEVADGDNAAFTAALLQRIKENPILGKR